MFSVEELDKRWDGYDKDKVVSFDSLHAECFTYAVLASANWNPYACCCIPFAFVWHGELDGQRTIAVLQGKDEAMVNKTKFLASILSIVNESLQEEVVCNVKHILKGKDPEGANRLLQNLAKATNVSNMDGMDAVQVRLYSIVREC